MKFSLESQLAEKVIAWLRDMKWEVYQEVQMHTSGRCADIVAVQGKLVWVIECKLSQSLAVIEQAWEWRRDCHFASIAVPFGHQKGGLFAHQVLEHYGIGRFRVGQVDSQYDFGVREDIAPKLNRKPQFNILDRLNDGHKTFAVAGNAEGKRWTPYQQTCMNIFEFVKAHPGCSLKECMDSIAHHYRKSSTAKACIAKWGSEGSVKNVEFRREGRKIILFPKAA